VLEGEFAYPQRELPAGITSQEARDGFALLCQAQARSNLTVEAREARPAPDVTIKSLPCRIERLERLADDVMAVFLRLPAVEPLNFRAGQYLDFMLAGGKRRSFSIASAPADGPLLEIHVRRASMSGFTGQLFDTMRTGTLLRIEGPLGQFWFHGETSRPALMIGGGTGYAPLRAMLRQLLAQGDRRAVTLYWGARTHRDLYEHDWLTHVTSTRRAFEYRPVLSDPAHDDAPWTGRTGPVHQAVLDEITDLAGVDVYASGPPAMIEAVRQTFIARGLPREQLHFDSFDYAPDAQAAMRRAE
jgi:CDP-4-dehydro-6-deoxyglucose reductase